MKKERGEALGIILTGLVWSGIAVILFLYQAHYLLDDFVDRIFGSGLLTSILKIPLSLAWILVYFGGPYSVFKGAK